MQSVHSLATLWREETGARSHVVQMIENGYAAAKIYGKLLLLLDRYFLSVPALNCLKQCNTNGGVTMNIITKAKKSCNAYEKPPEKKPGRGRPPKKGGAVKLRELFLRESASFQETMIVLYEKTESVRYYYTNLLWGPKLYQELRFVLVEYSGTQSILVSTDLKLDPVTIIRLYSC